MKTCGTCKNMNAINIVHGEWHGECKVGCWKTRESTGACKNYEPIENNEAERENKNVDI